ncbi:unnamed protein product [Leptosia nina]|uniref:Uncharacterized protein n=1 Tax=Leptosia nina TaxID=320188 RepID=A0AAV1JXN4_9NEOP
MKIVSSINRYWLGAWPCDAPLLTFGRRGVRRCVARRHYNWPAPAEKRPDYLLPTITLVIRKRRYGASCGCPAAMLAPPFCRGSNGGEPHAYAGATVGNTKAVFPSF